MEVFCAVANRTKKDTHFFIIIYAPSNENFFLNEGTECVHLKQRLNRPWQDSIRGSTQQIRKQKDQVNQKTECEEAGELTQSVSIMKLKPWL